MRLIFQQKVQFSEAKCMSLCYGGFPTVPLALGVILRDSNLTLI